MVQVLSYTDVRTVAETGEVLKMLMKLSADLSKQEIWAEGNELVEILGWDEDDDNNRIHERPYSEKTLVAEIFDPILLTDHF